MFENEKPLLRMFSVACAAISCIGNFKNNPSSLLPNFIYITSRDIYDNLLNEVAERDSE